MRDSQQVSGPWANSQAMWVGFVTGLILLVCCITHYTSRPESHASARDSRPCPLGYQTSCAESQGRGVLENDEAINIAHGF